MKNAIVALLLFFGFGLAAQVNLDPCIENHDFTIVVLGSSTAGGSGANPSDSAWVNRYRSALKAINPGNEVINLANGGYTTYKLMPNAFIPPAGRPSVDTLKNISAALKLNPDAIIVNLPSNDRQWPMNEQLSNFDSLYHHSWNNGVPLFVCTTQPIQSVSWATYQRSVRDSIINTYGPYAIEFFLPLADTNDVIKAQFAADAVHLNNSGHAILFNQAWQANVLGKVFEPSPTPDLVAKEIIFPASQCSDSALAIGVVIANLGDTAQTGSLGWFKSQGPVNDSVHLALSTKVLSCAVDTFWTTLNLGLPGQYAIRFTTDHTADTVLTNNTTEANFNVVSKPELVFQPDTLCEGQLAQFDATLVQGDTMFWYSSMTDTIPLNVSGGFQLTADTSLYVQGVAGPLFYSDQLHTTSDWNINFNGNMFNLVAKRSITLESFRIRSQQTGTVPVNVYTKSGSYQGFEQTSSAWALTFQDTLSVMSAGDSILLDIPDTNLSAGDTLAIYVHMANSSQRLLYKSAPSTTSYETNELQFLSGSGIGYNFGADYPKRIINARFNYRFGENLLGLCSTSRSEVVRALSRETLSIGKDTTLPITGITLQIGSFYQNPVWLDVITGDTLSTQSFVFIDSTNLQPGSNQVEVACFTTDRWGCNISDTIVLTLLHDFSVEELSLFDVLTYPSPFSTELGIIVPENASTVQIFSVSGVLVYRSKINTRSFMVQTEAWPAGIYLVILETNTRRYVQRVIKR